jgi:diacylglycerol kinase family enzyme
MEHNQHKENQQNVENNNFKESPNDSNREERVVNNMDFQINYLNDNEPNDFIVNITDSAGKSRQGDSNSRAGDFYNKNENEINIPQKSNYTNSQRGININDTDSNKYSTQKGNQFAKTIVVMSHTEEKKEEPNQYIEVGNINKGETRGADNFNVINLGQGNRDSSFSGVGNSTPYYSGGKDQKYANPRQKKTSMQSSVFGSNENETILFFFINPLSGCQNGRNILNMGVKKVEFVDNLKCTAYIFDMKDDTILNNGIEILKSELNRISLIRVVIGGGDNSVLPLIERLQESGVDITRCLFGLLPLGTGNDLSRALGWGPEKDVTSDMAKFKIIVRDLAEATSIFVDVWDVKLSCDETEGEIIECVKDNKLPLTNKEGRKLTTFKKSFINYFSLGFDARVGFGFNKTRTSYRCFNSFAYFYEACKKHCCRKPMPVKGFIDSFLAVKLDEEILNPSPNDTLTNNETMRENEAQKDVIFKGSGNLSNNMENVSRGGPDTNLPIGMTQSTIKVGNKNCNTFIFIFYI